MPNKQSESGSSSLRSSAEPAPDRRRRRLIVVVVVFAAIAGCAALGARLAPAARSHYVRERHPQTGWASCNRNARNGKPSTFTPLSDAEAAALITREPETRRYNGRAYTILGKRYPAANDYVPTAAQIRRYRDSRTSLGEPLLRLTLTPGT